MILFPSTWQEALHFPSRAGEGLFFHSIVWPWNSWQGEFAEWCGCILSFRQLNVSSPVATLAASPWRWEAARVASHSAKSQAALGNQGTRRISVCELHMHTDSFLSDIHFSLQMARSSKKITTDWHLQPPLMESEMGEEKKVPRASSLGSAFSRPMQRCSAQSVLAGSLQQSVFVHTPRDINLFSQTALILSMFCNSQPWPDSPFALSSLTIISDDKCRAAASTIL